MRMNSRHRGFVAFLVLGLALSSPVFATTPETTPLVITSTSPTPSTSLINSGLIDFSRVDISHSLSYGMSSSSLGTASGGLWVSRLGYQIANPLRISVDIGATINTMGGGPLLSEKNIFLKGFNLDYHPGEHFQLHISYQNQPRNAVFGYQRPGYGLGSSALDSPLGSPR
jgi:hypothetical protein